MNIDGLSLEDVTRLFRLAERDIEQLQREARERSAYAARLEAELEAVSPECPNCLRIRSDRGGDQRAPWGGHQDDCPRDVASSAHADRAEVKPIEDGNDVSPAGCLCGHDDFCHFEGRCIFEGCECEGQLVTSFLEDCEEAKSAEDVRVLIGRYRDMPNNSAGGSLHIVLDDGNLLRSDVEHCVKWAVRRGDSAGLALANLLLRLDEAVYLEVLASSEASSPP